jgi:hypothetical protein
MTYSATYEEPAIPPPAPLVALAGWCVPGLGYLLVGERVRAALSAGSIIAIFVLGILIAGVRCIDVPGFDANGSLRRAPRTGDTMIAASPFKAIVDKPWYIPQLLAGPLTLGTSVWSIKIAPTYPKATARLWDIGTLYTAVAGMLNLLVIIDSAHRAARIREANPRLGPM